jgi:DNA-directed RNA polymerase subunit omega
MILQSTDALEEYIGNKYSLVIVAAKRARQLKEGHPPLARDTSENKLSMALTEISEQRLQPVAPPEEELAPAPRDVIASLVAGAEFDMDEDLDLDEGDAVDDLAALLVGADEDADEEDEESETDGLTTTAASDDEDDDTAADEEDEEEEEDAADADEGVADLDGDDEEE